MNDWTPADWGAFFNSLGIFLGVAFSAAATFYAALAKIKGEANSKKIDENTKITVEGTSAAATNAKTAADTAATAAQKTEELSSRMNGNLDNRIHSIVREHTEPIIQELQDHSLVDEQNMLEIRNALADLKTSIDKK